MLSKPITADTEGWEEGVLFLDKFLSPGSETCVTERKGRLGGSISMHLFGKKESEVEKKRGKEKKEASPPLTLPLY